MRFFAMSQICSTVSTRGPRNFTQTCTMRVRLPKNEKAAVVHVHGARLGSGMLKIKVDIWTLTLICLSSAPVASSLPSGLKHTLRMYRSPVLLAASSTSTLPNAMHRHAARPDRVGSGTQMQSVRSQHQAIATHQVLMPVFVSYI